MSIEAVDHVFGRMNAAYGAAWPQSHGGVPVADVKTVWLDELSRLTHNDTGKRAILWALRNLPPDRPPNAMQFRRLCAMAPAPEAPKLEAPKADPARLAAELAKLAPIRAAVAAAPKIAPRAWPAGVLARVERGEKVSPTVLAMARAVGWRGGYGDDSAQEA